jgi:rRNA maturation endonuclease Nob1
MIAQKKISILIFDTNIFLTGIDINIFKERIYTTPKIIQEINVLKYSNKNRSILNKIEVAITNKHLIIKKPKSEYIKRTLESSKLTGDTIALSEADIELIALTLEMTENSNKQVILYTNDYSIQNLSSEMNLQFTSMFKNGIRSKIIFEVFCPICNKSYSVGSINRFCEICGSKLKRRPKKEDKNSV